MNETLIEAGAAPQLLLEDSNVLSTQAVISATLQEKGGPLYDGPVFIRVSQLNAADGIQVNSSWGPLSAFATNGLVDESMYLEGLYRGQPIEVEFFTHLNGCGVSDFTLWDNASEGRKAVGKFSVPKDWSQALAVSFSSSLAIMSPPEVGVLSVSNTPNGGVDVFAAMGGFSDSELFAAISLPIHIDGASKVVLHSWSKSEVISAGFVEETLSSVSPTIFEVGRTIALSYKETNLVYVVVDTTNYPGIVNYSMFPSGAYTAFDHTDFNPNVAPLYLHRRIGVEESMSGIAGVVRGRFIGESGGTESILFPGVPLGNYIVEGWSRADMSTYSASLVMPIAITTTGPTTFTAP
jgi:hypothetical protein